MSNSKQPRPGVIRPLLRLASAAFAGMYVCVSAGVPARAETPPKPALRLPLAAMGFPGHATALLHAGASMATVHLLDNTHLLLTYSMRGLVPRLAGDDDNDTDRQVAGVLVELPTGKVLARTVWHLHDHGRYLWNLGRGLFAVRIGDSVSGMAPLRGLASGNAFARMALPHAPGMPAEVSGSADGEIMTLQIVQQEKPEPAEEPGGQPRKRKHVVLEFFRLSYPTNPEEPIKVQLAGVVGAHGLLRLALDGDGFLMAEDQRRGTWQISFNEFGGKLQKIAPVLSSCAPRLDLVSRSEFLVTSCRGTDDTPMVSAYGFDGHEDWEERFGQSLQPPSFALAPAAGRFAMSRLVASASGSPLSGMASDDPLSQEIRVYQSVSGDLLLRVQCAPAARTAENFDLAPDGMSLAVMGRETLDIYRLPELTSRDHKDLAEAEQMQPPAAKGAVDLRRISHPVTEGEAGTMAEESPATERPGTIPSGAPVAASAGSPAPTAPPAPAKDKTPEAPTTAKAETAPARAAAGQKESLGDAPADAAADATPRKPPTLLNPGETPGFKPPSSSPQ